MEEAVLGFALLLLLLSMAAIGVTLTGIGGLVAEVSIVVFIVTLGLAGVAMLIARRAESDRADSPWRETIPPWRETIPPRWDAARSHRQYHLEDDVSGSVVSLREGRRF
jgi:hypothetical protein